MEHIITLFSDPTAWVALFTLIIMELVLGIDNLIFIAILSNNLPQKQRKKARFIGLSAALVLRIGLLASVAWIVQLTDPVITIFSKALSWKDLILIGGGLFLLWKATKEIHHKVDPEPVDDMFSQKAVKTGLIAVITQILLLDLVFSIDSIITAVGMTDHLTIMIIAVLIAVFLMMLMATPLSNFVNAHPTIVMLALSFLVMIGMTLIAEGLGVHVPKGYIYAAMAFSASVEGLNLMSKKAHQKLATRRAAKKPNA
jgi:predicted tellurium resistance membrane protein TerC